MHGARVLLVDDERDFLRALRINLSAHGYDVLTAENGEKALHLFTSRRPDVLVIDLAMPVMNGLELLHRLRQHSAVPIIMLSVHAGQRDKVTALDAGADDYITKPFDIEELLARIRAALRH